MTFEFKFFFLIFLNEISLAPNVGHYYKMAPETVSFFKQTGYFCKNIFKQMALTIQNPDMTLKTETVADNKC